MTGLPIGCAVRNESLRTGVSVSSFVSLSVCTFAGTSSCPETVTGAGCDTVTAAFATAPPHVKVNVTFAVSATDGSLPLVALAPLHPPLAVQPVAFVDDHVSVVAAPATTDVGFAVSETVGAGGGAGEPPPPPPPHADKCAPSTATLIQRTNNFMHELLL